MMVSMQTKLMRSNQLMRGRIDILETPGVKPYKYDDASLRRIKYDIEQL